MLFDGWMDKKDIINICDGIWAIKRNGILSFAMMWMDLENINLVKQLRERQILCVITYVWNLKNKTNNVYRKMENQLVITNGERERVWG